MMRAKVIKSHAGLQYLLGLELEVLLHVWAASEREEYFLLANPKDGLRVSKLMYTNDIIRYQSPNLNSGMFGLEDTKFGSIWFPKKKLELLPPTTNKEASIQLLRKT